MWGGKRGHPFGRPVRGAAAVGPAADRRHPEPGWVPGPLAGHHRQDRTPTFLGGKCPHRHWYVTEPTLLKKAKGSCTQQTWQDGLKTS